MEREIYNRDFVICNNNSVFVDSDYNVILLDDLIINLYNFTVFTIFTQIIMVYINSPQLFFS